MVRSASNPEQGIEVTVAVLGGELKKVFLEPGKTVADALEAAGLDPNQTVKVNGEEVNPDDQPEAGDRLVVTNKVKGGC